ncbi:MarR family transcriptional regulator [Nocardioides lentus]|uniref:MarR family transcriptional regulator n=1 Tax=Nocardioides lentus TaxID=338077 RepID=A0ABP5B3U6_9ACTN
MLPITADLEHELLTLVRRNSRIRTGRDGGAELERSSYAILCLLADEGPQRIGRIAQAFDLDPSTVTRQVQTVARLGMVQRAQDSTDRRATILDLTPLGRRTVEEVRESRQEVLGDLIDTWTESDRETFLRLLSRFNRDVADWAQRST